MDREYHRWFSPRLERDMELLAFGHGGDAMIVFPTRQGRFFDYENWGLVESVRGRIEAGHLRLFCLDSVDSEALYCRCRPPRERLARHRQYERYVLDEVIPLIRGRDASAALAVHGCSIGAYHAVNIAFRHPKVFCRLVALSGRYDLTTPVGPFADLFDGYYDEDVYFQMPSHFIPNLTDPVLLDHLRALHITLAVGRDDVFYDSTRQLSHALWDRGIGHQLVVWRGEAHRACEWREMASLYLQSACAASTTLKKYLVLYCSQTGNDRVLAGRIARAVNAEVRPIRLGGAAAYGGQARLTDETFSGALHARLDTFILRIRS